jgi:outer membrane lipoprotein-sorting protein
MRQPARISDDRRRIAWALMAVLTLVSGCSATATQPAAPRPTGDAPTVRRVLDVLDARDKSLASFRGQARLDYHSPEQSFKSTQVVVVRAPSSTRIDVMNPFGVSYTVATDGKILSAYDRRKSVFYQGHAEPDSFRHFIGIALGAAELSAVLRGLPPNLGESRWLSVAPTEGGWMLKRRLATGGVLELVVQAASFVPLSVKISADRERRDVEIRYADYRDVSGVFVPHNITVTFKDGTRLDLEYKSIQRGIAIADEAFHVEPPAGARFVNVDTAGGGGV